MGNLRGYLYVNLRKIFKIFLLLFISVNIIALAVLGVIFYKVNEPLNSEGKYKSVIIEEGQSLQGIGKTLEDRGIISKDVLFILYSTLEGRSTNMKAGSYRLSPSMSIKEVAYVLSGGENIKSTRVTIPEGFRIEEIGERLNREGAIQDKERFINLANISAEEARNDFGYTFLEGVESDSLEGFLFPDTYKFKPNISTERVLRKLLDNFSTRTEELRNNTNDFYSVLILASILEKEVQTERDMRLAAGVFNNRIKQGMLLQADATLTYITDKTSAELTRKDLQLQNPYNTYQSQGLPPTPISNPGVKAIKAAINPAETDYLYYLSAPDGTTHFAETLEEHNRNKAKYLK